MRILLAGATGVIGRRLGPMLGQAGHTVFGTTRRPERRGLLTGLGMEPVLMDALDAGSVRAAVEASTPEVIVHQLTDLADLDFQGNSRIRITGTRNLVDAAREAGVSRMIAQSISWVYAPGADPATEEEPAAPSTPGVAELERMVGELPAGVVLRYGLLYGPGTWYARDGMNADRVRSGDLTPMAGTVCFVHVDDAASAAVAALDWPAGPVNVVDDEPAHPDEWMPVFAAAVGAPEPQIGAAGDPGRPVSNALARSRGWTPAHPSWRTGFARGL